MITATATINKGDCIYAKDGDIERYSDDQIPVLKVPLIRIQTDLFGDSKDDPF
jgi:hypothetical protein